MDDYYPDLVLEFYATMLHKIDNDLPTIISTVKVVRIILDRARLATFLGIRDEGNMVTVDSNNKTILEDSDWSYAVISSHLKFVLVRD